MLWYCQKALQLIFAHEVCGRSFFKNFKATKSERKKLRKKRGRWSKSTYLRSQTESKLIVLLQGVLEKRNMGSVLFLY